METANRTHTYFACLWMTGICLSWCKSTNADSIENIDVIGTSLKRHPIYETVTESEFNSKSNINLFEDLTFHAPSFGIVKSGRQAQITSNGIGFNGGFFNPAIEPTIPVYLDNIYLPRHSLLGSGLLDIASIQFTDGYTHNTKPIVSSIGSVNIGSKSADLSRNYGLVDLKTGTDKRKYYGIGGNLALSENAAFAGYAYKSRDNGKLKNLHTGRDLDVDNISGGYLRYRHNLGNELTLSASYTESRDKNDWHGTNQTFSYKYNPAQAEFLNTFIPLGYQVFGVLYPGDGDIDLFTRLNTDGISNDEENKALEQNRISNITLEKSIGSTQFTSITGYIDSEHKHYWDTDNTDFNLGSQEVNDDYNYLNQEFSLEYEIGNIKAHSGLHYSNYKAKYDYINFAGDDLIVLSALGAASSQEANYLLSFLNNGAPRGKHLFTNVISHDNTERYSLYSQFQLFEYNQSPLRFGFSLSRIDKDFSKHTDGLCAFDTSHLPIDQCAPTQMRGVPDIAYFDGKDNYSDTLFSFFILKEWKVSDNVVLFASGGKSEKPGGFNAMQTIGPTPGLARSTQELFFEPEKSYSLNIGLISLISNGNHRLNFDLYARTISDYQLNYFDGVSHFVTSANEVKSYGLKVNFNYRFSETINAAANINYAKSYYSDHTNAICPPLEYRTLQNCSFLTIEDALAAGGELISDLSGSDLRTPRLTFNLALKQDFHLNNGFDFSQSLEYRFTGKRRTTEFVNSEYKRGGYGILNYYLSSNIGTDYLELTLTVKNITDKEAITLEFPSTIIRGVTSSIASSSRGINALTNDRRSAELSLRYFF